MTSWWNWSLRIGRLAGVEIRIHWTLFALALYYALGAAAQSSWLLLPILLAIPFLSILLHEFGHVTAARLVGGDAHRIVLWMFGGLAMCEIPASPGRQFFVAAAGPLVNLALWAGCALLAPQTSGWTAILLGFTATWNLYNLLFNLIPVYPMDGGRMLRAALWPVLGKLRAVKTTIIIGYVGVAGMILWGGIRNEFMLFAIGAWTLIALVQEHLAVNRGYDPYTGGEMEEDWQRPSASWLDRWRQARAERQNQAREAEMAEEQAILDRLLAKVGEQGLPSLTDAERKTLHRISKRQRERDGG